VLRHDGQEALMVQHRRRDGTTYWQLPGGGVEAGERTEAAVLRELREETGIEGRIVQFLFAVPYKYGQSMTFLVEVDPTRPAILGHDPEEAQAAHRKLIAVAWRSIAEVRDNTEIAQLLRVLPR
jgi:8-oxo-dGTP pyrophosphatase MutT (NUDIX family)